MVWRAVRLSDGLPVAIKCVRQRASSDDLRRFEREAKALQRMTHRHCVRFLQHRQLPDGTLCVITEFIDGLPIDAWAQGRSVEEITVVAAQVAAALSPAHRLGIVHRDLKPANILVTEEGERPVAKVLDFGLATLRGEKGGDVTKTGEVIGTPGFMSPEQLRGLRNAGPPSDVYCLGLILFELLEGRPPFEGSNALELSMKSLLEPAPPLQRPVPAQLQQLLSELLAKDPTQRPSAAAIAERLGYREEAAPARAARRSGRIAAALGTVAAIAVAVAWLSRRPAVPDAPRPDPPRTIPTALLRGSSARPPTPSPDPSPPPPRPRRGLPAGCGNAHDTGRTFIDVAGTRLRAYVPTSYDPTTLHPVLVLLHESSQDGGEDEADGIMNELALDALAEARGVILVAPISDTTGHWPASSTLRAWATIAELPEVVCVDRDAVFVLGHGGGAKGADQLACTAAGVAGVITSSSRFGLAEPACPAGARTPYLHLAPFRDSVNVREGRKEPLEPSKTDRVLGRSPPEGYVSLEEHVAQLRARYGCKARGSSSFRKEPAGECLAYDCDGTLVVCEYDGERHWPGHRLDGVPVPPLEFDLREVVFDFVDHARAARPGRVVEADGDLLVYEPRGYISSRAYPAIIALHEKNQTGGAKGLLDELDLYAGADREGYLLFAPTAEGASWDVDRIRAVLAAATSGRHAVDPRALFVLGHNSGGQSADLLACGAVEQVTGVISAPYQRSADGPSCTPVVPLLDLIPTRDPQSARNAEGGKRYSSDDQIAELRRRFACATDSGVRQPRGTGACSRHQCDATLEICTYPGARHWPGYREGDVVVAPNGFPMQDVVFDFMRRVREEQAPPTK